MAMVAVGWLAACDDQSTSAPVAAGSQGALPSPTASVALKEPSGCSSSSPEESASASVEVPQPDYANVAYADASPAQRLDLFLPAGDGPFPLIIRVHGGAFRSGDKSMDERGVAKLTDAGFAVAAINYRLSCEALFPAAPQDVFAATRFLRASADEYALDPGRFAVWGESAGANLAALVGVAGGRGSYLDDPALGNPDVSSEVQAVVGWYGLYNFLSADAEFAAFTPAECTFVLPYDMPISPVAEYLGAPQQRVPELAAAASPGSTYPYVIPGRDYPPFSLAAGTADCIVPTEQTPDFDALLASAGVDSEVTLVDGAGHADDVLHQQLTPPTLAWLSEQLGPLASGSTAG